MKTKSQSLFKEILGTDYFNFEEDFVEKNVRCIPMIVRFKMDMAGIKLKLEEWSKFSTAERIELATKPCGDKREAQLYHHYLAWLVQRYTKKEATGLAIDENPGWIELKMFRAHYGQSPVSLVGRFPQNNGVRCPICSVLHF